MERTLVRELSAHIGKEVVVNGWITVRRDQGKLVFFDIRDRSGTVQGVVLPGSAAMETAKEVRQQCVVAIHAHVNTRPEKNVQKDKENGDIELEIKSIEILSAAESLPFDLDAPDLNLETVLDYRPFTLRNERSRDIFTMQAAIVQAYRKALQDRDFTEFQAPALVGGDAEGGAAVFKVEYFNGGSANLATSPQFYKQIMVAPFERAFTIAKIFRAEKSATTRHLSEITQMDFEMGFIEDERDVMDMLADVIRDVVSAVSKHKDIFERFQTTVPLAPAVIPAFTLREAQEIIKREYGRDQSAENDMAPEDERQICEWAKREHGSDFVFITRFPTEVRAFYTYEDAREKPYSRGFDLLFRGLEINSGSQRIHSYDEMIAKITAWGMDPKKFAFYLQAFKYGMPPHGGCSTGLERITARMLELPNVKEASAFPRDMTRIDSRLSEESETV